MRAKAHTRRKKRLANWRRSERLLFYYPLSLPGDPKNPRLKQFTKSYVRLGEWMVEVRNQKLLQRVAEFHKAKAEAKRKHAATMSAYEILRETADRLDDPAFDAEDFRRRLLATGLNREELRALFDQLTTPPAAGAKRALQRDEATIAQQQKDLRVSARKTRRDVKHLKDEMVIFEAVQRLFDSAVKLGDENAAKRSTVRHRSPALSWDFLPARSPNSYVLQRGFRNSGHPAWGVTWFNGKSRRRTRAPSDRC
jgi:hypothetical protein